MSIRTDLDKLLQYAKLQNITINIEPRTKETEDAAEIDFSSMTITLYQAPKDPIKYMIVSILHELSHLVGYRNNPQDYEEYFRVSNLTSPTMMERYEIFSIERRDVKLMPMIALLLGIKHVNQEVIMGWVRFDTWQYWYYYTFGVYPGRKERVKKLVALGLRKR